MTTIFRHQAIEYKKKDIFGELIIEPDSNLQITVVLLSTIFLLSLIFLFSTNYAKKETVAGILIPEKGIPKIISPRTGIFINTFVKNKDVVTKGDLLFTIKTVHNNSLDSINQESFTNELEFQSAQVSEQINQIKLEYENKVKKINILSNNIILEIDATKEKLKSASEVKDLSFSTYEKAVQMYDSKNISELELQEFKSKYLNNKVAVDNYKLSVINLENKIKELTAQKSELELKYQSDKVVKAIALSQLKQSLITSKSDASHNVYAPVSGTVTSLIDKLGGSITAGEEVMAIIPKDSYLIAKFNIPNKAAGFISEGQNIKIRYKSFPYQKFGVYNAKVLSINNSIISAKKMLTESEAQVNFIVDAELDSQFVNTYGKKTLLKPGMQVEGDIIIENRTLIEWLFEPLFTVTGKLL